MQVRSILWEETRLKVIAVVTIRLLQFKASLPLSFSVQPVLVYAGNLSWTHEWAQLAGYAYSFGCENIGWHESKQAPPPTPLRIPISRRLGYMMWCQQECGLLMTRHTLTVGTSGERRSTHSSAVWASSCTLGDALRGVVNKNGGLKLSRLSCDYPTIDFTVDTDGDGMVAKDYPFYLVLNRSSCCLEVQTLNRSLAKEVEVCVQNTFPLV